MERERFLDHGEIESQEQSGILASVSLSFCISQKWRVESGRKETECREKLLTENSELIDYTLRRKYGIKSLAEKGDDELQSISLATNVERKSFAQRVTSTNTVGFKVIS